ncbi:hypothetical protein L6467_00530 [Segatella bryantii]|uniref:hypothetical protein n=1 Tax=Segatella bryantii TaxID=77095 RepID=UPI001EDA24D9|nr:hypothetical protein [Segatella bryantii]UKK72382.1 hypothetical protein L6467_00530 [Segatella bryantii]
MKKIKTTNDLSKIKKLKTIKWTRIYPTPPKKEKHKTNNSIGKLNHTKTTPKKIVKEKNKI